MPRKSPVKPRRGQSAVRGGQTTGGGASHPPTAGMLKACLFSLFVASCVLALICTLRNARTDARGFPARAATLVVTFCAANAWAQTVLWYLLCCATVLAAVLLVLAVQDALTWRAWRNKQRRRSEGAQSGRAAAQRREEQERTPAWQEAMAAGSPQWIHVRFAALSVLDTPGKVGRFVRRHASPHRPSAGTPPPAPWYVCACLTILLCGPTTCGLSLSFTDNRSIPQEHCDLHVVARAVDTLRVHVLPPCACAAGVLPACYSIRGRRPCCRHSFRRLGESAVCMCHRPTGL
jgi:hypothetical protein